MRPDSPTSSSGTRWIVALLLVALPFALFWWQLPFVAGLTIGNDYTIFPTRHQQELLFSLRMGSFPLFVPGFSGGHTASALTLGQLHHPLSWLASLGPGYWDGLALDWNTCLRLLSIGLTHLVLFRLLRRLHVPSIFAAVLSGITVYNLRMLDLFRYGAALESYVAFLVACAAVLWNRLEPERVLPRAGLVVAVYCLVTSGHPQMMYYGLLGAGLTTLVAPSYLQAIGAQVPTEGALRFYGRIALLTSVGLLLAAAYVSPFYFDFLGDNSQRVGRDYAWANGYADSFFGTLNSFFLPLHSRVGGAFGGSSLFLVAALTPVALLFRVRVPAVVLVLWGLVVFVFLHMQGERTPVHELTWKCLPLAGSFRIAGRIAILLPLLFLLLLVWQVRASAAQEAGRRDAFKPCVAAAFLLFLGYGFLPDAWTREAVKAWPVQIGIPAWAPIPLQVAGAVGLFAVWLARVPRARVRGVGLTLLCLATLVQAGVALRYGTWVEERVPTPGFEELRGEKRARLEFTGDPGVGLASSVLVDHLARGVPREAFLGRLFSSHVSVPDTQAAYASLAGPRDFGAAVIEEAPEPTSKAVDLSGSRVEAIYTAFNRVTFAVEAAAPAFLGFGHPYSPHWIASLDGNPVRILRANGAYQGVWVPAGSSVVDFRYDSAPARWGMLVSAIMLSLSTFALVRGACRGATRSWAMLLALSSGPVLFLVWRASLYGGADLETDFEWTAPALHSPPELALHAPGNLAFGRKAWITSLGEPETHSVSRGLEAVDGLVGAGTGALSRTGPNPVWVVELAETVVVAEVVVHEGDAALGRRSKHEPERPWNRRPLLVQTSVDGENWDRFAAVRGRRTADPVRVSAPARPARFVRIVGKGTRLALDEVLVYGP